MSDMKMNMLQKLAQARLMFLNEHVKKSGKNFKLEFTYFELKDIVPSATRIFAELGVAAVVGFDGEVAKMELYNAENPEESPVAFAIPYREAPQIISNAGKEVTNPLQALGASITYLRRYLYMLALDIVEDDQTDASLGEEAPAPAKKPVTTAERKKAKEKLTKKDDSEPESVQMADEKALTELKDLCKELVMADQGQKEFIGSIAVKTKNFTAVPAPLCSQLVEHVRGMIEAYKGREA